MCHTVISVCLKFTECLLIFSTGGVYNFLKPKISINIRTSYCMYKFFHHIHVYRHMFGYKRKSSQTTKTKKPFSRIKIWCMVFIFNCKKIPPVFVIRKLMQGYCVRVPNQILHSCISAQCKSHFQELLQIPTGIFLTSEMLFHDGTHGLHREPFNHTVFVYENNVMPCQPFL